MLVNLEEAERRVESPCNLINKLIERKKIGDRELTNSERVQVRVDANLMTIKEAAIKNDVSERTVRNCKEGFDSVNHERYDEVVEESEVKLKTVRSEAIDKLMIALGLLNISNLKDQKARDLAGIAANLSKVAANMEPRSPINNQIQVVVYSPNQKNVEDFRVVEVR